ncbi:hypothetical protein DFJ74DRAFT_705367 [Hyaloraphidium curvatum]|nr:hypothetical protein DFJ74DRAFT_705367 [Hyaloraphidium curvatum]
MLGIPALAVTFATAQWPSYYLAFTSTLASYIGPFWTSVFMIWSIAVVVGEGTARFWDYIDHAKVWEEYRIQKGKRVPDEFVAEKKQEASKARFTISPLFIAGTLWIIGKLNGADRMDITKAALPKRGALGLAFELAGAVLVWDWYLFWIHATLHYFPYLYKTIHKKHHEFKVVNVFVGGHLAFVDLLLMDRLPLILTAATCRMNIHVFIAFIVTYIYMASHAHCGFAHPWDPMQWVTAGNGYHDQHHKDTWVCYQSFFTYLDRFFGTDPWSWAKRHGKPNHEIVKQDDSEFKRVEVMGR